MSLLMLVAIGRLVAVTLAQLRIADPVATISGTLLAMLVPLHETASRCASFSLVWHAAVALMGCAASPEATLLFELFGWAAAPSLNRAAITFVWRQLFRCVPTNRHVT